MTISSWYLLNPRTYLHTYYYPTHALRIEIGDQETYLNFTIIKVHCKECSTDPISLKFLCRLEVEGLFSVDMCSEYAYNEMEFKMIYAMVNNFYMGQNIEFMQIFH